MAGPVGRRRRRRTAAATLLGTVVLVGTASARQPWFESRPVLEAAGSMAGALVVGAVLLLVARPYTTRATDRIRASPVRTFLYGFGILLLGLVALLILFLSVIGIVLAIPLLVTMAVFAELGFLAAGRALARNWVVALVVAVLLAGFSSAVPILGPLVGAVLAAMGLGSAYLHRKEGTWRPSSDAYHRPGELP